MSCDDDAPFAIKIVSIHNLTMPQPESSSEDSFSFSDKQQPPREQEVYLTLQLLGNGKPLIPEIAVPRTQEWHRLPIKNRELPLTAQVVIKVRNCVAPEATCIAGVSYDVFNKQGHLRMGKRKLQLWPVKENDESSDCVASGKISVHDDDVWRIEKLVQEYKRGKIPYVGWLDQISFNQIAERINDQSELEHQAHMYIEFPAFEHEMSFHEMDRLGFANRANIGSATPFDEDDTSRKESTESSSVGAELGFTGQSCREQRILNYPTTKHLSAEEKELVWKFQYYIKNDAAALTKFARCVDWSHRRERKQAVQLISEWEAIEVDHALELLSASFAGINPLRRYAVKRLEKAKAEELLSYLLQLVHALRYEKGFPSDEQILASQTERNSDTVPTEKRYLPSLRRRGTRTVKRTLTSTSSPLRRDDEPTSSSITAFVASDAALPHLAQFLIDRAIKNPKLANFLYWYLTVEATQTKKSAGYHMSYKHVLDHFTAQLGESEEGQTQLGFFERQKRLTEKLIELYHRLNALGMKAERKTEKLREWLADHQSFDPMPHPLNPDVIVTGLIPEKARVFSSAMAPLKLVFRTDTGGEYPIIFKCGDDLRQDQLIIQLISLMDSLLKKVKFDLCLTPYSVLAMSYNEGMMEFIPSMPLRIVLAQYGRIQTFLRHHHAQHDGPYGIERETLDTYTKSLAGYCVVTYLLGVGDRHFDNIMLRAEGNLFHIDFGFILGADPKIFPPPFRLTTQMVDAMGGVSSEDYEQFKSYCSSCFIELRKNANLILNLFSLMVDADIPGITALGGEKSILKVQEKFMLDLTPAQADEEFQHLIQASLNNKWAPFFDETRKIIHIFK